MFTKLRYSVTSHVFCQILSVSVNFEAMYIKKNKDDDICVSIYIYMNKGMWFDRQLSTRDQMTMKFTSIGH